MRAGGQSCWGISLCRRAEAVHIQCNEGQRRGKSFRLCKPEQTCIATAHLRCREQFVNEWFCCPAGSRDGPLVLLCSCLVLRRQWIFKSKGVLCLVVITAEWCDSEPRSQCQRLKGAGRETSALGSAPRVVSLFYTVLTVGTGIRQSSSFLPTSYLAQI